MKDGKAISKAYYLAVEFIYNQTGGIPMKNLPGKIWEGIINNNWMIAINLNKEKKTFKPEGAMEVNARFGEIIIWFCGWTVGILTPSGGSFVNGRLVNEDEFIKILERN